MQNGRVHICFLATVLPFAQTADAWVHFHGLLVGLIVGALVTVFIFPENYARLFIKNSNLFLTTLGSGLSEIRKYLLVPPKHPTFDDLNFVKLKDTLSKLIEINQMLQHSSVFTGQEERINHILIHQYALSNIFTILLNALRCLWKNNYELSDANRVILSQNCEQYADLSHSVFVNSSFTVGQNRFLTPPSPPKGLVNPTWVDTDRLMVLLNLKLSFDLFNQQFINLLKDQNGA